LLIPLQFARALLLLAMLPLLATCRRQPSEPTLRLAYFPNVTHAQAVLGVKRGTFQEAIGSGVKLQPTVVNAGPSVIEGIYANAIDIAYVGPSPIINGFVQSEGEEIRVVAGSALNGVLIIGSSKRGIHSLEDLRGKRIATPQLGNTQDISARDFVVSHLGSKLKDNGGDTEVVPITNPDIENLFSKNQLDGAWVPEPWGSRIIGKGFASLLAEEKDLWPHKQFALTNIVVRRKFLEEHPVLVQHVLEAHIRLTRELQQDPMSVADELNAELKRLTTKDLAPKVMAGSLKHTQFDVDPNPESIRKFFEMGKSLGIVPGTSLDLDKLIDSRPLQAAKAAVDSSQTTKTVSIP